MKEIKGWTVLSEDFVAPQTLGQEGEPPIVPATDDNKKEGEKDNTVVQMKLSQITQVNA